MKFEFLTDKYADITELKKAYKSWAKKLHPDAGGDTAKMQALNNEFDYIIENHIFGKARKEYEETHENVNWKSDDIPTIFAEIVRQIMWDDVTIELIGAWLWVTGNTFPHKDELSSLGFQWSGRKKAWYFATTVPTSGKPYRSVDALRKTFGSKVIKDDDSKANKNSLKDSKKH